MKTPTRPVAAIHHVTAIAGSAAGNNAFYTTTLGLRRVKKTVNFDDPGTYHFYFADAVGTPGTLLTFFPWEGMRRGRSGAGQVTATALAVPREALGFWRDRLAAAGLSGSEGECFGDPVLRFPDPDGLLLELVGVEALPEVDIPDDGPVAAEASIRGFHGAALTLRDGGPTADLLVSVFGATEVAEEAGRRRFRLAGEASAPGRFVDLAVRPDAGPGRGGSGTVHHIAFRAADDDHQAELAERLREAGIAVTPVQDRQYFRSIYFREPGGVLFEIATDPPGMLVDESREELGRSLRLPARLEPLRARIEAALPPLGDDDAEAPAPGASEGAGAAAVSGFPHVHVPAERGSAETLLAFHGTGGDEHDLVPLARRVHPEAAILSPRGRVLEHGMPRFFRRLAEGVFDEEDLAKRTAELADWISAAVDHYRRDPARLAAIGYSNGANIAASLLFDRPGLLGRAVLLRPMLPREVDPLPDLSHVEVLILAGRTDAVIPASGTRRLIERLGEAGARVETGFLDTGHQLVPEDLERAAAFLGAPAFAGS